MEPHVRIELTYPIYRTGASPAMLTGRKMEPTPGIEPESTAYRAAALPLSYIGWSGWPGTIRRLQFGRLQALPSDDTRLTNYLIFKEQKEKGRNLSIPAS